MTCLKIFAVFAVACRLSLAADCDVADEVSLVQKKQVLKHGEKRDPTPVHDDYAITDSMPDHLDDGQVVDAWKANMEKVKNNVEQSTAESLEFDDAQHEERVASAKAASAQISADKHAVNEAVEADRADVEKVADERAAVIKTDTERVAEAKEDAEAHAYKQAQAQAAAVAGRETGFRDAVEEGREARNDMLGKWEAEEQKDERDDARAYLAKQHALKEAAVNKDTKNFEGAEAARVANYGSWKRASEAESAADAAAAETDIEGPEGMNNHMLDHEANRAVAEYTRRVDKSQDDVDEAAEATYPSGYWPAGP